MDGIVERLARADGERGHARRLSRAGGTWLDSCWSAACGRAVPDDVSGADASDDPPATEVAARRSPTSCRRTPSSSAGGATPRRSGTGSTWSIGDRTSRSSTTDDRADRAWAARPRCVDSYLGKRPVFLIRHSGRPARSYEAIYVLTPLTGVTRRTGVRGQRHESRRSVQLRPPIRVATYNPAVADVADRRRRPPTRSGAARSSFPPTTRRRTSRRSSPRRSRSCRRLADEFEIIAVDDGSTDEHAAPRRRARCRAPARSASSTTRSTRDTARRCASGFRAARYDAGLLHRWRPAVQGRPTWAACSTAWHSGRRQPDVVVGYRIKRADPFIRRPTRACTDSRCGSSSARRARRRLRLQAFPARGARRVRLESGGAFLSAELLIKLRAARPADGRDRRAPLPAHGRIADRREAAVVFRAVRDFWRLRLRLWANRAAALERGEPVLG